MNLTDLPEEILVMIVKKLDLKSVYHLYQSCHRLKNIVCMINVVKTCIMRLNTMATAQSFKLQFIKDISGHLLELDIGGVLDVTKTSLLVAVKRMKCLKTLDVAYTNITIEDLIEVYKICPTIKNISCNLIYSSDQACKVPKNILVESQKFFKNFENINIIGNSTNLLYSCFSLWVMRLANVNNLCFTVAENHNTVYAIDREMENDNQIPCFKNFNIYILHDWRLNSLCSVGVYIPTLLTRMLSEGQYEFITVFMPDYFSPKMFVSPMFESFLNEYLDIETKCVTDPSQIDYVGNALIMLWKKSDIVIDEMFYRNIKIRLSSIFPNIKKDLVPPGHISNYAFKVLPEIFNRSHSSESAPLFKKKRKGAPSQILDYDNALDKDEKIRLTLYFEDCNNRPIMISSSSQYLKKLTYLSLNGVVLYGIEFFKVLFSCCENLETLNIETPNPANCIPILAQSISMSLSLKHFRLLDKRIDCKVLFSSLSQCKNIENIHLVDVDRENNYLSDPSILVRNCANLYFIFIHASMSTTAKERKYRIFKKLKEKFNKPNLNVQLNTMYAETKFIYDPYIDVFRLNPIRSYD